MVEFEVMKRHETGGIHLHFLGVRHGVSGLCAWWKRQSAGWADGIETTAVRPWGIWLFIPAETAALLQKYSPQNQAVSLAIHLESASQPGP